MVKCKLTKADGADLTNAAAIAPVNLFAHALWSNIAVNLCGKGVVGQGLAVSISRHVRDAVDIRQERSGNAMFDGGIREGRCEQTGHPCR